MNFFHMARAALATLLVSVCATSSQGITTILVDHDDGLANGVHDVAVRNGGFESPNTGVDGEPFSNTDNWVNLQGPQGDQARRTNISDTGSYASVNTTTATRMFGLDTQYTIAAGDFFELEFRALRAFQSDATTTLTADLFFTDDDTISGTATVLGSIVESSLPTSFANFGDTFTVGAGDPAVGKNLFLRFEQSSGPGFSRTDSWYLAVTSVNAVPEPASATLGLLALGTLAMRRKRAA